MERKPLHASDGDHQKQMAYASDFDMEEWKKQQEETADMLGMAGSGDAAKYRGHD